MISVGSRDERKGVSLRFDFEGEKMELDSEIEEGEACFQNNNGDYDDSTIDPDISLSYIDEKIQNVLGHCQKEFFEGEVSAENLGSKFGGYGSFLPTYQRSPVWPHPKTPPNNAHIEVGHQNSVSQSSASQPSRNGPSGSIMNNKLKQEAVTSCGENSKSVSNFGNDSDPKSLKVRIKVGSDNFSTRKKAEIYSGLGLDVSPSSSLEASPVNSDGFFHGPQNDHPDESPTSILEIMTSFPVSGSLLLSPLPYDVLHLTEKKFTNCEPMYKGSQESTVTAVHESNLVKVDQNVLEKKPKSSEKNSASMESTNGEDAHTEIGVLPKKETSIDHFAPGNKTLSSGGKKKSKASKSFTEDIKKNSGKVKVKETYKDFFGELDLENEDNDEIGLEKPSEGINVKSTLENNILLKEKLNGKKNEKPSSSVYAHVPTMGNGLGSDAAAPTVVPVVNEDWVCCDKCEKWRLLPPGVNPGSLPEKWLCSMLDWLPGMNRCIISEEETTKAITSRFPGPSVQGSQPVHPGGPHQQIPSQIPSLGVKKKHGLKDFPNEAKPSMSSNSLKKNGHISYKTRSLNGANQSPHINEVEFQDSGHSRDVIAEKEKVKLKEKNKLLENFVDEGNNTRHSKTSNKRESGQDLVKDYKKVKTDNKDETFHMTKFEKIDGAKKRKKLDDVKETSETNSRKEKKARVLNVNDVKSRGLDVNSSKRDTIRAATSSSSKVSGSHKTKTNNQESKGSPVESVSSSPMRILNKKTVEPLKKNVDIRPREEKSKIERNKSHSKTHSQSKHKHHDGSNVRIDANSDQDLKKPSKKDVSGKGKSNSLPPRSQNEIERVHGLRKENVVNNNNNSNNMSLKVSKQNKKAQNQNGNQSMNIKHPSPNSHKGKDQDAPGPYVRDISNQATTSALREATNLKHMADRVKNGGSSLESRAIYIQAALKFLHVASLFEFSHNETGRYGDMIQSISIYSSTAKLCEYCAREYERTKEMTTAALAYKCMEVAYMKVIYSSHSTACKDVNELLPSLQIGPTGESPSSSASASDLDNLNNPANGDKAALIKGVNVPQVGGNHVIAARNKPNFTRILNFTQDVNSAMEASRKSRVSFAASSSKDDAILSAVKKALDFNFHDVDQLLHLVRVAMDVIIGDLTLG